MCHGLLIKYSISPIDFGPYLFTIKGLSPFSILDPFIPSRIDTTWSKEMRSVVAEFREGAKDHSDKEIESIVDEAADAVRKA